MNDSSDNPAHSPTPSPRTALSVIGIFSALVVALLFWLIYFQEPAAGTSLTLPWLPGVNALFNAISASCVTAGIVCIKRGGTRAHAAFMSGATLASAAFLAGYLTHHYLHGDTRFLAEGALRYLYFFILITHVLLSIVVFPMVLATLTFAACKQFDWHKRIARYTYPLWLYVSVTGILIYVFLRLLNPA